MLMLSITACGGDDEPKETEKNDNGDQIVFLQIGGRWKKTGTNYWLKSGGDVRAALASILGEDAVHVR